jgi:hypothetical protein
MPWDAYGYIIALDQSLHTLPQTPQLLHLWTEIIGLRMHLPPLCRTQCLFTSYLAVPLYDQVRAQTAEQLFPKTCPNCRPGERSQG